MTTTMIVAPEVERARPVGDYIEALVTAVRPEVRLTTADEWIDAAHCAGIKLSITTDVYTGTPLHFSVQLGESGYGRADWERFDEASHTIGESKILAALHARTVADPLLDLVTRTLAYEANPCGFQTAQPGDGWHGFPLLNDELKSAPAATTIAGVLAGLDYGFEQVRDFDLCGDGSLRGAIAGLREILMRPAHQTVAACLNDRNENEQAGTLLGLIETDKAACDAYNRHLVDDDDENARLSATMLAAGDALEQAVIGRGELCVSIHESRAAAERAAYYHGADPDLAAALALSALGYFLGEEAVS